MIAASLTIAAAPPVAEVFMVAINCNCMRFVLTLNRGQPSAGSPAQVALAGSDLVVGSADECDWRAT